MTWGTALRNRTLRRLHTGRVRPVLTTWQFGALQPSPAPSGQQSTEPGNLHKHWCHEINTHRGYRNNHRAPVSWGSQALQNANPGFWIHEAVRSPYEAETTSQQKWSRRELHPPEQNTWMTTKRHPWPWPKRDPNVSCLSCLEKEKGPHPVIPLNPLSKWVLDSCLHCWLCWECCLGWVYIQFPGIKNDRISLATSLYSIKYTTKTETLKTATHVSISSDSSHKVVHTAGPKVKTVTDPTLLLPFATAMQSPYSEFPSIQHAW